MKRARQAEIRPAGDRDGMAARGGPVWDGGRGSRSNTDADHFVNPASNTTARRRP